MDLIFDKATLEETVSVVTVEFAKVFILKPWELELLKNSNPAVGDELFQLLTYSPSPEKNP